MRGVIYFLWGTGSHATQLAVSLLSLRRYYDGEVAILTPDPAPSPGHMLARDPRLKATVAHVPLCQHRRNSAHTTKTWIHRYTPFDPTIFLDADTFVTGSIDELWPEPGAPVWTGWHKWRAFGSPVEGRIVRFAGAAGAADELEVCRKANPVAVNTGVFAFHRTDSALEPIHALCCRGHRVFIPDECAAQLLFFRYPHRLLDDRFNLSPVHGSADGRRDPRVVHCHGGKVLHRAVRAEWLALLREAWTMDLGGIRLWMPDADRKLLLPLIGEV